MKTIRNTAIEFVLIGVVSVGIALIGNSVRARGSIDLSKNHFYIPPAVAVSASPTREQAPNASDTQATASKHAKHSYQEVDFDAVRAILEDPSTASGLNVFIDARSDEDYEEGHIPGALQCYPYEIDVYIDGITDYVLGAEKVVIYCGGGDCEDSIFMCRELAEMGVPQEAIFLFHGGWSEWTERGGEIETGREGS